MKKRLKEYYSAYYNGHFLRDFRYLYDNPKMYFDKKTNQEKYSKGEYLHEWKYTKLDNSEKKALNFLTSRNHLGKNGLLGGQIAYYHSLDEYHEGNIMNKYCDRLFFDLDVEDSNVEAIKSDMKEAYSNLKGSARLRKIGELKSDFRDMIFNRDLVKPTFDEARKLCLYLEDLGLKPYLVFSGAKGFHVNVFFDEMKLNNFSQISKSLAKSFSKKLNLKYLDYAVFDKSRVHNRLQRCQYAVNSKTELVTLPIPYIYDYDEVLAIIKKNKRTPIEFNFQDWTSSEDFSHSLKHMNDEFNRINARKQREIEIQQKARRQQLKEKFGENYKSFENITMEDLCGAYGISGEDKGDRIIVKCPFHSDRNPSAVIFKNSNYFHCSTCNLTLNYWSFIAEMEGIASDDKSAIVEKLNELRR